MLTLCKSYHVIYHMFHLYSTIKDNHMFYLVIAGGDWDDDMITMHIWIYIPGDSYNAHAYM